MARYGKAASESVKNAVHREKRGELRSGKDGRGGVVKAVSKQLRLVYPKLAKGAPRFPRKKQAEMNAIFNRAAGFR